MTPPVKNDLIYIAGFVVSAHSTSDETRGKGVFQGSYEAHPVEDGAHYTGLSPLRGIHSLLPHHSLFLIAFLGC